MKLLILMPAVAMLCLFGLIMLLGLIGKGMKRGERIAAFCSGAASLLLFIWYFAEVYAND